MKDCRKNNEGDHAATRDMHRDIQPRKEEVGVIAFEKEIEHKEREGNKQEEGWKKKTFHNDISMVSKSAPERIISPQNKGHRATDAA